MTFFDEINENTLILKWLPPLSDLLSHYLKTRWTISINLYILFQYISSKWEDARLEGINNYSFTSVQTNNTNLQYSLNLNIPDSLHSIQSIDIPEAWVVDFFSSIWSIEGRELIFEYYMKEYLPLFSSFSWVWYLQNNLDEIIWEFAKAWPDFIMKSFQQICETAASKQEQELIFYMIHVALPWEINTILIESLEIVGILKRYHKTTSLSSSQTAKIQKTLLLLKISWKEISFEALIENRDIYTFVPNLFSVDEYWENNTAVNTIFSMAKKYRPQVINKIEQIQLKAKRSKSDLDLGAQQTSKYTNHYLHTIKQWINTVCNNLTATSSVKLGLEWYKNWILPIVDQYKHNFTIWTTLFRHEKQKQVMNLVLGVHQKRNPEQLAHIPSEEYVDLYTDYYAWKLIHARLQLWFTFANKAIIPNESFPLWEKVKQIIEKKWKATLVKLPLGYKAINSLIKWFWKIGIKKSVVYTIPAYLWANYIIQKISNTKSARKFQIHKNPELSFSAELNKFIIENIHILKDISLWLELIQECRELQKQLNEINRQFLTLKAFIDSENDSLWPHEEHLTITEDLDIQMSSELSDLQSSKLSLDQLTQQKRHIYANNHQKEVIDFFSKLHDILYREHLRANTSYEHHISWNNSQ